MSIQLFKTLIAISEQGSYSTAAAHVCVSQAAVGQQMKRLEDTMKVELFDRSQRTPQLNHLGRALVPKAKEIVTAYESVLDSITGDAQLIGELTLGAVPSTISGLIPQTIKKLIEIYSDLHIRVVPGLSADLYKQIAGGVLDVAVISQPVDIDMNLIWYPLVEEKLVLLTSPEVTENDPLKILSAMPYIRLTRRAAVGMLAEEWLLKNSVIVQEAMVMESIDMMSSMIAHNLGVSLVPNLCVSDATFDKLQKVSLGPTPPHRTLGILIRSDCSKIHLVERLIEQIESTL